MGQLIKFPGGSAGAEDAQDNLEEEKKEVDYPIKELGKGAINQFIRVMRATGLEPREARMVVAAHRHAKELLGNKVNRIVLAPHDLRANIRRGIRDMETEEIAQVLLNATKNDVVQHPTYYDELIQRFMYEWSLIMSDDFSHEAMKNRTDKIRAKVFGSIAEYERNKED